MIEYKNELKTELNKIKKITTIVGIIRFIVAVLCVIFLLAGYFKDMYYLYIVSAILLPVFIASIFVHARFSKREKDASFKIECIEDNEKRRSSRTNAFRDYGLEFADSNNYYEADLDVFGKNSLYKHISVATTGFGRKKLADALKDRDTTKEEILYRQKAVMELAEDKRMNIDLQSKLKAYRSIVEDNKYKSMENALNNIESKCTFNKLKLIGAIAIELLLILSILLSAFGILSPLYIIIFVIVNFFATIYLSSPIREIRSNLIPINNLFSGYDDIISAIISYDYKSECLNDIKNGLSESDAKGLKSFTRLEPWITSGNNIIFEIIFNGLFGFDTWLALMYDVWQKKYNKSVRGVVERVADLEALLSLSTIALSNDDAVMPLVSDTFEFEDLKHPLISQKSSIGNDFKFDGMNIITGSNMSGKTTFMRTVGISYILFKAGGFVVAKSFKAGIYKLFTSMKVIDDTSSGISTFYAEILRVKAIVEYAAYEKPMLVLVDEIFKGTNTLDRVKGATEVINTLNKAGIYSIITTHDFELCDTDNAKNFHFMEHYENNEIKFDYKIYEGRSQTTDAIYLLKMAGIIKE